MDLVDENSEPNMTYPLVMGYLPPAFVKKAEIELLETQDGMETKMKELRHLLKNEDDINDEWFSDDVIITYLRARKYDVPKALKTIKKLVSFVRKYDAYFEPLDPNLLKKCHETGYLNILPIRNKDGCFILIGKLCRWDPSQISFLTITRYFTHVLLHLMKDPMTQECMPFRIKGIHFLNSNVIVTIGLSFIRMSLSKKLKNRIFIHSKAENILDHLQANVVPTEYGGQLTSEYMKNDWLETTSMPDHINSILNSKRVKH